MRRAEYSAIPIGHHQVIAICKTVGARLCTLLSVWPPTRYDPISIPAPKPFSPFSSSSSNLKLRGTFAVMTAQPDMEYVVGYRGVRDEKEQRKNY